MNITRELKLDRQLALKALFDCYAVDIYRVAFRILKDQYDSEDIVQEVFIKVWSVRHTLDENGNIWSFLYVITKRLALNKLRDKVLLDSIDLSKEVTHLISSKTADSFTYVSEISDLEKHIINRLPKQQQQVYLLSREEGLTYKEIAERLNISQNTVRNHIVQSLKFFKRTFQKYGYHIIFFFLFFH